MIHSEYNQWSTVTMEMDEPMEEFDMIWGRMHRGKDIDMLSLRRWKYIVAQVTGEQMDDRDIRTSDNNRATILGQQHVDEHNRFLVIDVDNQGERAKGTLYKNIGGESKEEIEAVGSFDSEAFEKTPEEVINFFKEHHDFQGFIEA